MYRKLKALPFTLLILTLSIIHQCPATVIVLNVKNDAESERVAVLKSSGQSFSFYPFQYLELYDSLSDLEPKLSEPKKPPTLSWEYEDSFTRYTFMDQGMNNRLVKWIRNGWKECIENRINPHQASKSNSFSCMEFAFYVSGNVKHFSPHGTADLQLEDVGEEDLDKHANVGDIFIIKVYNMDMETTSSFAGHTLIYAGNDYFISAEIDGSIYFQSLEQVKRLWAEPGEGVYDVKLKLFKVKKSSIVKDETGANWLSGSTPKPVKKGVKEPPAAMSKPEKEQKKAEEEIERINKHIQHYFKHLDQRQRREEQPSYINYVSDYNYTELWQNQQFDSLFKKGSPQIPPFMFHLKPE